jgi:hypothetical protein
MKLPKSYDNWKDAEHRRKFAREYGRKRYKEGLTWAQNNPEKVKIKRRRRTLRKYNLTLEEWNDLFLEQGKKCAICKTDKAGKWGWATDHNHITGMVRGILCSSCNTAIGQMKDDPLRLRLAADYLEKKI